MKFFIDDKLVYELTELQIKTIKDNVFSEEFEKTMADRVRWIISKKYEDSLKHLKDEWIPKLKEAGLESLPLDDGKFTTLVLSQKDYKSRSERDKPLPEKITL